MKMEFTYKDGKKFAGLYLVSGESRGWQLRSENLKAELGLRTLGVIAITTLSSEEGRKRIQKAGWNEAEVMALAGGEFTQFTQTDPFDSLERLIGVVVGTDQGLQKVIKEFGWNIENGLKNP
jgi:hypothetical protein